MINVLVVDDHAIFREGIKKVLAATADIVVAAEAGDGRDAAHRIREGGFDVVVLDIALPGKDGIAILRELKAEHPGLPILILSMYPEEQYAVRVLKEGASGYLTKEGVPNDLIAAIRRVAQGRKYVSESLAERLAVDIEATRDGPCHERLSGREYQVFLMIASGKTTKEIAHLLSLSPTTISTHKGRILEKMGMKNTAEIVRYAVRNSLTG
jgi:two-component system, NarL family, invasion response regulator UvrY